jgi:hypothetical protein
MTSIDQFINAGVPEDTIFKKIISARPITNKLIRSPFDEGGGSKGFVTNYMEPIVRRDLAEAIDEGYDVFRVDSGRALKSNEGGVFEVYDEKIPKILQKIFKQEGLDPKEYVFQTKNGPDIVTERIYDLTDTAPNDVYSHTGTFVKIDDKLRKIFRKNGLPTYRKGGIVNAKQSL